MQPSIQRHAIHTYAVQNSPPLPLTIQVKARQGIQRSGIASALSLCNSSLLLRRRTLLFTRARLPTRHLSCLSWPSVLLRLQLAPLVTEWESRSLSTTYIRICPAPRRPSSRSRPSSWDSLSAEACSSLKRAMSVSPIPARLGIMFEESQRAALLSCAPTSPDDSAEDEETENVVDLREHLSPQSVVVPRVAAA